MFVDIAVRFLVANPGSVASFLAEVLDFEIVERDNNWWASNGAISIVLELGAGAAPSLRLQSDDLEKDSKELARRSDIQQVGVGAASVHRASPERLFDCACGLELVLFQQLNEDDQNHLVELPSSLPWDDDTDLVIRELLRLVPVWVRDSARKRVVSHAEYLAVQSGALRVGNDMALQAFVDCTLPSRLDALFSELSKRGINTQPYIDRDKTC